MAGAGAERPRPASRRGATTGGIPPTPVRSPRLTCGAMRGELQLATPSEPLGLWSRRATPPAAYPDLQARHLEFSSRGDRVAGRLLLPAATPGPLPAVLLQHDARDSAHSPTLTAAGGRWARRGLAVASIDFPLHRARAESKLCDLLLDEAAEGHDGTARRALAVEFTRQAVIDLQRALDALSALDAVDAERVAFAGFGLGARIGTAFCALDSRPRATALALGGADGGPAGADPTQYAAGIAPGPLLLIDAARDSMGPRSAADALYAAAAEPKQRLRVDAGHDLLSDAALKAMGEFLARHLELEKAP